MSGYGVFPPEYEYHNLLINPDFLIAQEGTSFASMSSGDYIMDGYKYLKSGAMVHTGSQDTDVPTVAESGSLSTKSLKLDCTTADASIAAGDYCCVSQRIEGRRALPVLQQSFTLRFLHKHTKTGTYCVAFRNSGSDRSFIAEYTQDTTDTWELATIRVDASPTGGTWDYTNGIGLEVAWALAGGSTYQTTAGSWASGDYLATSNQVNACDSTSNNFRLSKAWLYPGTDDIEFFAPVYDEQLNECQRYFEKSYTDGVAPGESSENANEILRWSHDTYSLYDSIVEFKVDKRAAPSTVTLYSTETGASGNVAQHSSGDVYESDKTSSAIRKYQSRFEFSGGGNIAAEKLIHFHWTADARL